MRDWIKVNGNIYNEEDIEDLEQQLAEANELLKKANNYGGCEFREINEYFEKYKD